MTEFIIPNEPRPIADLYQRFIDEAPPEFRACLAAGVEMECSTRIDENGHHITMTTKNPVAVVQEQGRTAVYEKRLTQ